MGVSSALDRETDGAGIAVHVTGRTDRQGTPLAADAAKKAPIPPPPARRVEGPSLGPGAVVYQRVERVTVAAEISSARPERPDSLAVRASSRQASRSQPNRITGRGRRLPASCVANGKPVRRLTTSPLRHPARGVSLSLATGGKHLRPSRPDERAAPASLGQLRFGVAPNVANQ